MLLHTDSSASIVQLFARGIVNISRKVIDIDRATFIA